VSLASPGFRTGEFERALRAAALGRRFELHESIGSTNDRARELARDGAPHGTLVVAEEQAHGRGRHGRAWHSPRGQGVWASVLLLPRRPVAEHPQVPLLAGLAVADALRSEAGAAEVRLRWPNDVDLAGRKVAGILCESAAGTAVIAGIGINVERGAVPPELADSATSLAGEGLCVAREALLAALLGRLEERLGTWEAGGFEALRGEYLELLSPAGREVRLTGAGGGRAEVRGVFDTVDARGALVLRTERGVEAFHAGQVERVR
jgi:BirA family transcriptional regulator, biotin operon repressor / biotin---[acetyl-CoA-carboxylase] ligase